MRLGLLIEDSSVIRTVARRILEDHDFEVVEAADAQKGLDLCRQRMPDLIIVDWKTGELPGAAFVRALRAISGGSMPKVVSCTTENDADLTARALSVGADFHILKPFDRDVIEEMLEAL